MLRKYVIGDKKTSRAVSETETQHVIFNLFVAARGGENVSFFSIAKMFVANNNAVGKSRPDQKTDYCEPSRKQKYTPHVISCRGE
jgi:hypothetical protein